MLEGRTEQFDYFIGPEPKNQNQNPLSFRVAFRPFESRTGLIGRFLVRFDY